MALQAGLALGAASAALSYGQAQSQNRAAKRARDLEQYSISIESAAQREQIRREYAQFVGSVRASAASRGVGQLGSAAAIQTAALGTYLTGVNNINANARIGSAQSEMKYSQSTTNPFLAGILGGLDGLAAGATFGSAFSGANVFGSSSIIKPDTFSGFAPDITPELAISGVRIA